MSITKQQRERLADMAESAIWHDEEFMKYLNSIVYDRLGLPQDYDPSSNKDTEDEVMAKISAEQVSIRIQVLTFHG